MRAVHRPLVIDGGLATALEAAGHDLSDELWSARLLHDDPGAIVDVHRAFLDAGASVVTTASYQATVGGFTRRGYRDAEGLLRRSVALAREACRGKDSASAPRDGTEERQAGPYDRPLWTAASIGPYGAVLADGSEYRGDYGLSIAELVRFHRPRMALLADAGPDLLALETVPDAREAEALLTALSGLGVPAWLSFTIAGDRTRAGQPLADAFALARGVDEIIAVGVNCSDPGDVTAAVPVAARASGKPVVVYPNSGETWDATARRWTGTAAPWPDVTRWVADGARFIGGCCRVTPPDIAALSATLSATDRPQDRP